MKNRPKRSVFSIKAKPCISSVLKEQYIIPESRHRRAWNPSQTAWKQCTKCVVWNQDRRKRGYSLTVDAIHKPFGLE